VAATLTDELTRVSVADIEKWEEDGDTLYVYGKCTTPEVDTDEQVVDSRWSGSALKEYLATAPTVRVQHNPQRDPAGSAVRVDVNRDGDGAHWLKAAVDEPIAQRLVKKGHLRAFSVGIVRPLVERDVTGKARGGIIRGGKVVEVSLVDSPANRSCFLELSKADKTGACEFTGKMVADEDVIQKALGGDLLTKDSAPALVSTGSDTWTTGFPGDLSVNITPDDIMRVMQQKFVSQHYDEMAAKAIADAEAVVYKRDIDTATRRRLASEGSALPDGSYPIENGGDLDNAAILARSGHGNVAAARRLIARRARELGVANPLDESDEVKKVSGDEATMAVAEAVAQAPEAVKEAEPEVTKDPEPEPEPKAKPVKKAKKPKKLPPWLNKPKDDGDSDDDDDKADKAAHCGEDHEHTDKCHTPPSVAAGVTAAPMDPAPVGELMESDGPAATKGATPASASGAEGVHMDAVSAHREPDGAFMEAFEKDAKLTDGDDEGPTRLEAGMMKSSPEVAAVLRFQRAGIDMELGKLHDLTCPAYHPETVAEYHPFSDFRNTVDERFFQRKAVEAAAGPSLGAAKAMGEVWQAATLLRQADEAVLNQFRLEAHKAFRDANPGPGSAPTPGSISPGKFNRPLITDGHEASSAGHDGPTTSPQVAASAPSAHSFDRPPLSAGHQSPSPSFMKASFEYPAEQGRPTQLRYDVMEKDRARQALVTVHEHLSRQFPEACPMSLDAPQQPERHPVPPTAGIGKAVAPEPTPVQAPTGLYAIPLGDTVAALKAEPEGAGDFFSDADVYKSFKKMRKKLGKKVLSGKMTVDEARAKMGRQFAQKGAELQEPAPEVQKGATIAVSTVTSTVPGAQVSYNTPSVPAAIDPDVIKSAVAEALAPVAAELTSTKALLAEQQETFTTRLAEQQKVIDAIADQPDPSTAAFTGLAFNPVRKAARPAGVTEQAEAAERVQRMMIRELETQYNSASDPAMRESYYQNLCKMRGVTP